MEWKIGEIRQIKGEWYQCINPEIYGCSYCDLQNKCIDDIKGKVAACHSRYRSDKKCVVFKKLEKVGEPTVIRGKPHQKFNNFVFRDSRICQYCAFHHKLCNVKCEPYEFYLEIKQNKEDMEENKISLPKEDNALTRIVYAYVNGKISDKELIDAIKEMSDEYPYDKNSLKPFSLELAKSGKPVCTRDGRRARIICFDRNDLYPIVALIECEDRKEMIGAYSKEGHTEIYEIKGTDLMMLPEKKEGWAVIRREDIYETEEQAKKSLLCSRTATMIRKIEWEE